MTIALIIATAGVIVIIALAWLDEEGKQWERAENQREAARAHLAERNREACEICSGKAVYLCPECLKPISTHTHENDFICETHSFITPIRQQDGARICGDGRSGPLRVLRHEKR